ncbi:MAG: hypothetical protein LW892_13000, partial [Betaproteobacteria bacterium]|nr:hypothetical protein [Betaproteobacteria bacterium]
GLHCGDGEASWVLSSASGKAAIHTPQISVEISVQEFFASRLQASSLQPLHCLSLLPIIITHHHCP